MYAVIIDNKTHIYTPEEFFEKYGDKIDKAFFNGAYSKHLLRIDNKEITVLEVSKP